MMYQAAESDHDFDRFSQMLAQHWKSDEPAQDALGRPWWKIW